jgi:hypothetical protein
MKTWILCLAAVGAQLSAPKICAQYYYYNDKFYAGKIVLDAGFALGAINCLTDLGGSKGPGKPFLKDINLQCFRPCVGLYAGANYRDLLTLRFQVTAGTISSADSLLYHRDRSSTGRYGRNLSFRSRIAEAQLAIELHPLFLKAYGENEAPYWSPYFLCGIGYYLFNPQAMLQGRWYELQPLRLEGQGLRQNSKPYSLRQINLPMGIGIRYEASLFLYLRLEIVHRILFTDYLDDVSRAYIDPKLFETFLPPEKSEIAVQLHDRAGEIRPTASMAPGTARGNPEKNDSFFSIQLKMGFVLRAGKSR